ncbi:MAG: GNAT family N-acetyltransferase [Pseudomonadota bacterium]
MSSIADDPPEPREPAAIAQFTIRAARVADYEGIAALQALPGYRAGTLRTPFQSPEGTRKFLETQAPGNLMIVAVLEERIVGMAGLERYVGRRAHVASFGMGVHDDHRRQGIGAGLLDALIDAADNWFTVRRLELTVFVDNVAAIKLYERAGFEREGVLRMYALRDGAYVDAYQMARLSPEPGRITVGTAT